MLDENLRELARWLSHTTLASFMSGAWEWPIAESLHFMGLSMLMGTVGLFDLRLLGLAKRIPLSALHRLIPWGIGGFVVNMLTGVCFLTTAADQYMYNPSFQIKLIFIVLAGINVIAFYLLTFRLIHDDRPEEAALRRAKLAGAASLVFWIGVMSCGRLLTFYRPPFHWCFWC